ncbi:MAG: hypothetical protein K8F60_09400 [Melioribacteraceae bacterium]|nr:hypothetical protein [Melioribacteraceae bacterium]
MKENKDEFKDQVYKEISYRNVYGSGNIIKAKDAKIVGSAKIALEQESHDGVKIILKKDEDDNIKEIKFVCSCGETKSILLDYSE